MPRTMSQRTAPTNRAAPDPDRQQHYWWTVRERPGVGRDMLVLAGGWFVVMLMIVVLVALFA